MGRVLVTGAVGELGKHVVGRLVHRGEEVIAFVSEGSTADVPAGVELIGGDVRVRSDVDKAVHQSTAVVHLATSPFRRGVDTHGTTNVAYACTESETHMIYVGVVGSEKSRLPYYRTKAKLERLLEDIPGLAFTVQRATQFHSTLDRLLALPVIPVPGNAAFHPVDPEDLAGRLVGLIEAGPSGRVRDFAGPAILTIDDMAEIRSEVCGRVGRPLPMPKLSVWREAVDGIFTAPDGDTGHRTYRDWLIRSTP